MTSRKPPKKADEVEDSNTLETKESPVIQAANDLPQEVKDDNVNEEFNQHIKNLVALYAQQIPQELEQRISDLETIVVEQDAVQFIQTQPTDTLVSLPDPPVEVYGAIVDTGSNGVGWYQPPIGT